MRQLVACFGLSALLLTNVYADGYLWLSGAGELPARVFRYNLRTGQVDRVVEPGRWGFMRSRDYNLLAYDGNDLYVGLENDRTLLKLNPYTGALRSAFAYQMCNCFYGHHWMKDGTIHNGEIWRAAPARSNSSPGIVHVSNMAGLPTNAFYGMERPDLQPIGLEWVGDALLITTANGLHRAEHQRLVREVHPMQPVHRRDEQRVANPLQAYRLQVEAIHAVKCTGGQAP